MVVSELSLFIPTEKPHPDGVHSRSYGSPKAHLQKIASSGSDALFNARRSNLYVKTYVLLQFEVNEAH